MEMISMIFIIHIPLEIKLILVMQFQVLMLIALVCRFVTGAGDYFCNEGVACAFNFGICSFAAQNGQEIPEKEQRGLIQCVSDVNDYTKSVFMSRGFAL